MTASSLTPVMCGGLKCQRLSHVSLLAKQHSDRQAPEYVDNILLSLFWMFLFSVFVQFVQRIVMSAEKT